jgi:anaphase-promoting complex subunit 10
MKTKEKKKNKRSSFAAKSAMAASAASADVREARDGRSEPDRGVSRQDLRGEYREIGDEGVWMLSSAKPGFGVEQLRDSSPDTYWQSDGTQPHSVTVCFSRKVDLALICIFLAFPLDESYTPSRVAIRVGSSLTDAVEVKVLDLNEPHGWVDVPLGVRGNVVQLLVLGNHQSGRDTHVRLMRIYGPRTTTAQRLGQPDFQDPEMSQYMQLR